jgi:hypothetical protein
MSVSGIASSSFLQPGTGQLMQPSRRQSEDQIGRTLEQDLQSGNLQGAQQAYYQLAAFGPNNSGPFNDPTMKAEFQTLGQDLQAGNLSAAQSDNSTLTGNLIQKDEAAVARASGSSQNPNSNALAAALANLKGDYWAVYGTEAGSSLGNGSSSSAINVQA